MINIVRYILLPIFLVVIVILFYFVGKNNARKV